MKILARCTQSDITFYRDSHQPHKISLLKRQFLIAVFLDNQRKMLKGRFRYTQFKLPNTPMTGRILRMEHRVMARSQKVCRQHV